MAFGDVVADAIAGHVIHGVDLLDITGLLADDDGQFDFPIGLDGILGNDDIVIGADDGAGGLHEDDRLFGDLGAGLGGMIGIVEADADEFPDIGDTGADALVRIQFGQHVDVGAAYPGEALGGECLTANIGDDARKIANGAVRGKNGGLFSALGADAKQFHGRVSSDCDEREHCARRHPHLASLRPIGLAALASPIKGAVAGALDFWLVIELTC